MPGLGAVEVGAVGGEDVVRDYVERGRHDPAVEGRVEEDLKEIQTFCGCYDMEAPLWCFLDLNVDE